MHVCYCTGVLFKRPGHILRVARVVLGMHATYHDPGGTCEHRRSAPPPRLASSSTSSAPSARTRGPRRDGRHRGERRWARPGRPGETHPWFPPSPTRIRSQTRRRPPTCRRHLTCQNLHKESIVSDEGRSGRREALVRTSSRNWSKASPTGCEPKSRGVPRLGSHELVHRLAREKLCHSRTRLKSRGTGTETPERKRREPESPSPYRTAIAAASTGEGTSRNASPRTRTSEAPFFSCTVAAYVACIRSRLQAVRGIVSGRGFWKRSAGTG